jgi:hypothetical protein
VVVNANLRTFIRDEQGGYTIWSLTWFMLYVAIGGLAVDVTDAYRTRTALQSTADAAALAAVMSLPDEADAVAQALSAATGNMNPAYNGDVLRAPDVVFGTWDFDTHSFSVGDLDPNAVWVVTRRADQNGNPVGMNFLRILSLIGVDPRWNIATEAIAVTFIPKCVGRGLVALNNVRIAGNNEFVNEVCIHGQNAGVSIQNNNFFEPGVYVSMGDFDDLKAKVDANDGLDRALREGDLYPKDVDRLAEIIEGLIPGFDNAYTTLPDFMYAVDEGGLRVPPVYAEVKPNFAGPYLPHHVYYVACPNSNTQVNLPNANEQPVLENVVIVAECRIHGNGMGQVENLVLASLATGRGQDPLDLTGIHLAAGADMGTDDGCAPGGGIEIYAAASVKLAAGGNINGLRAVVAGDFEMTAGGGGVNGIAVEAGHDIVLTSNNVIGSCPGNSGGPYVQHFRLVR